MVRTSLPTGVVTFLFTDIEGSTRLIHTAGDRFPDLLGEHHAILRGAIERYGGLVVRAEGDGGLAVFDRPADAVSAALDAQRSLRSHPWPQAADVRVRMGIHTGPGVLLSNDYVGIAVNTAARICDAAHGGQVLLSDRSCLEALQDAPVLCRFLDLGEHRLKDVGTPHRLHQLVHPDMASGFPPLRAMAVLPNNLPAVLTTFVGRERELGHLAELLRDARLITITGPGGSGKTRLAVEVGVRHVDRYRDGVWLAELAPLSEPAGVVAEVARVLGIREEKGRPLEEALVEAADGDRLLILDNCEHLVDAVAELAEMLLQRCRSLTILCTSREALAIPGESVHPLSPLPLPEAGVDASDSAAVRLFAERAAAARPGFTPGEDHDAVVQVCRRLDGIPLAIELAAALVRSLSPTEIASRLDDRFRLLSASRRGGPRHHQTLRATVDWSWELLTDAQARLLARLSIFPGSFTLDAVEAVCEPANGSHDLARLVDMSLVALLERGPQIRYRLLETIRAYAAERLSGSPDLPALLARYTRHYLELAEMSGDDPGRLPQQDWHALLDEEHENLLVAVERSLSTDPESARRLAVALEPYWSTRGMFSEGRRALESALDADGDPPPSVLAALGSIAEAQGDYARAHGCYEQAAADAGPIRARALIGLGNLAFHTSDYEEAEKRYSECLELFRDSKDDAGTAQCLHNLATVAAIRGEADRSASLFDECLGLRRRLGDPRAVAETLNNLSVLSRLRGDLEMARAVGEEGLVLSRELGHRPLEAAFLVNLGIVATRESRFEDAWVSYLEALDRYRGMGSPDGEAGTLNSLGNLALYLDRPEEACQRYEESLVIRRRLGDRRGEAESLNNLGMARRMLADGEGARAAHEQSLRIREDMGDRRGIARSLTAIVQLDLSAGLRPRDEVMRALELSLSVDDVEHLPSVLETAAELVLEEGRADVAARVLGTAEALRERISAFPHPSGRRQLDELAARLSAALGEDFERLRAEGRTLEPPDAARLLDEANAP